MCFGGGSTPPPPAPLENDPGRQSEDVDAGTLAARLRARQAAANSQGRNSTVRTGGRGVTSAANTTGGPGRGLTGKRGGSVGASILRGVGALGNEEDEDSLLSMSSAARLRRIALDLGALASSGGGSLIGGVIAPGGGGSVPEGFDPGPLPDDSNVLNDQGGGGPGSFNS